MSTKNNPFDMPTYDLGLDHNTSGQYKHDIDHAFRTSHIPNSLTCVACGSIADYRLIAKHTHLDTEELRKQGLVCQRCVDHGYFSPQDYGIRKIK